MKIETGQTLLHYRVSDKLGEGGMGVVWKAVDTTLDRDVAIKVLSEEVAHDAELLSRFKREARTLAALNHSHIGGIHGIEGVTLETSYGAELPINSSIVISHRMGWFEMNFDTPNAPSGEHQMRLHHPATGHTEWKTVVVGET